MRSRPRQNVANSGRIGRRSPHAIADRPVAAWKLRQIRRATTTPTMRIGITCYPTDGGSGVVATELGMELAARGHDVHFITYAPPIRINLNDPHIHYHE